MSCFYKCNLYNKKKYEIHYLAIKYQTELYQKKYSYDEILKWQEYFLKYGKRYGLLKEFRENGII